MSQIDVADLTVGIFRQGVAEALPVSLAALGEVAVERSGVVNIGLEGMMLVGALAGWWSAAASGSAWIGLVGAAAAGASLAALFGVVAVFLRCDQIVTGLGINLLAIGLTGVILQRFLTGTEAPALTHSVEPGSPGKLIGFAEWGGFDLVGPVAIIVTVGLWWILFRTMAGLSVLAAGENPAAADSAGLWVSGIRFSAVLFGGALAGLGGGYLSIAIAGRFQEEMTAGRGFLALALVIFGRWSPQGALLGTLLVGFLLALQQNLQPIFSADQIHTIYPLLLMAPYVVTMMVLAAGFKSARAPSALGQPYWRS